MRLKTYRHITKVKKAKKKSLYFLYEIVYIGQTKDLRKRVIQHRNSFKFDLVRFKTLDASEAELAEAILIEKHKPIKNSQKRTISHLSYLMKKCGMNRIQIEKKLKSLSSNVRDGSMSYSKRNSYNG
jgi:hypothetical protein